MLSVLQAMKTIFIIIIINLVALLMSVLILQEAVWISSLEGSTGLTSPVTEHIKHNLMEETAKHREHLCRLMYVNMGFDTSQS